MGSQWIDGPDGIESIEPRFKAAQIDLVAVAYQAPEETGRFLASIAKHIDIPFTLTVIDNNSPDPEVRYILKQGLDEITFHPNFCGGQAIFHPENLGYAKACNLGAKSGTAPIIGLLNCDVQWTPGAGQDIYFAFADIPPLMKGTHWQTGAVGVVGPKNVSSDERLTHGGIVRQLDGHDGHRFWMAQDYGQADDVFEAPTVSGSTYFIRRAAWEELTNCPLYQQIAPGAEGAFLPTQHYFEETFCSYHARAHGWKIMYRGDIKLVHEWHKSSPVGGEADGMFKKSESYFRDACLIHDIELTW